MDMRNGDIYPDLAAARAAGVPEEAIAEVEALDKGLGELVRVTKGPFKGRIYERTKTGLRLLNVAAVHPNQFEVKTDNDGNEVLVRKHR
jgi:hypothetical protein